MTHIAYMRDPDFSRPLLEIDPNVRTHMLGRLGFLYGRDTAEAAMPELERILKVHHAHKPQELIEYEEGLDPAERFTERDMILITYADAVRSRRWARTRSPGCSRCVSASRASAAGAKPLRRGSAES